MKQYRDLVIQTEAARRNAGESYPRRPCKDCGALMKDGEHDWLYKRCCDSCGMSALRPSCGQLLCNAAAALPASFSNAWGTLPRPCRQTRKAPVRLARGPRPLTVFPRNRPLETKDNRR